MDRDKTNYEKRSKPFVREATIDDVDRLVEVEFETFQDVYEVHPSTPEEVRSMITTRLGVVQDLMIVGEVDGVIEGVMACQRTNLKTYEVKSWEETTNNGTLIGTHVPDGRNFYIVNLAVTNKGSEHNLSDQLIALMISKFVEARGEEAHLLSRIPQFAEWVEEQGVDFGELSEAEQDALAEQYVGTTKIVEGKERLYDGVLQRYVDAGVKPVAVLRDAYADPCSLNYEVLCVYENFLPKMLKNSRAVSLVAGRAIRYAANHPAIMDKLL